MNQGKLIIITGFMASGKDTISNLLLGKNPGLKRVVTHATRPQRQGEIPGLHHHFVSILEFEALLKSGEIIEHVIYEGHYKGTSKREIIKIFENNNVVWQIDMSRVAKVEELFYDKFDSNTASNLIARTVKVCLKAESNHVILSRYKKRDRKNFDNERVLRRLEEELNIWSENRHLFPNIITNYEGKLDQTIKQVENLIYSM